MRFMRAEFTRCRAVVLGALLAGAARLDAVADFWLVLVFWPVEALVVFALVEPLVVFGLVDALLVFWPVGALLAAALPLVPIFFAGGTFSAPSCDQPETAANKTGSSRNRDKNRLHIAIGFSWSPYDSV
jgi:hypothetical protein